jgi:NTP pyrophosphatase (non-canonical NTP hydrolase)
MADLDDLKLRLRDFAAARDWEQFHTPKNLAMALVAEAAEVVEHFQWLTPAESEALDPSKRAEVALELADVLLYLVMLADSLDIDLVDVAHRKININEKRFPSSTFPQEQQ